MHNQINLLSPSSAEKASVKHRSPVGVVCICLMIAAVAAYGALSYFNRQTQNAISQVQRDVAVRGKQGTSELAVLTQEKNRTAANLDSLRASRPLLSKYLDKLTENIPPNVVLNLVEIKDSPLSLNIRGVSPSPLEVAQFVHNLQGSLKLSNCTVSFTSKQPKEAGVEFVINMNPGVERRGN